jgi:hypothetical protein
MKAQRESIHALAKSSGTGGVECLATGSWWFRLRRCRCVLIWRTITAIEPSVSGLGTGDNWVTRGRVMNRLLFKQAKNLRRAASVTCDKIERLSCLGCNMGTQSLLR